MGVATSHRERIVRAAMRLFQRQGYAATGVQEILTESRAPKGSLYHHFPEGKLALGAAATAMAGESVRSTLEELADRHRDPRGFVRAYCKLLAGWMADSGFRSGCPIATTLLETTPESAAVAAAGCAVLDDWMEVVGRVFVNAGMERREARVRAQTLIAAVEGALIIARVRRSARPILDVGKMDWVG